MQSNATIEGGRKIAVVGSGISGLSAAWLLSRHADVTLYESEHRAGGHSNTVDVADGTGSVAVDTGFIVYNDRNYPNLVALFDHLNVPTSASDMSFAASLDDGAFEYSGSGFSGLLGQRSNVVRPRFWSMLRDIMRFYREAPAVAGLPDLESLSLGEYLDRNDYGRAFVDDHLLPMGAAIWSASAEDMRAYPLKAFVRFFVNHGLLLMRNRPQWRTVTGGSREYVNRLLGDFSGVLRTGTPVTGIVRGAHGVTVTSAGGHPERFDRIVIATHADQALQLLTDADDNERRLLGAFSYTPNTAVLHSDPGLMPKRKSVWSSWNYMSGRSDNSAGAQLCVTYWMNLLQPLPTKRDLFVTLNPSKSVVPDLIHKVIHYRHPLFNSQAIAAQKDIWSLQGNRNTWFCGAYFGSGFHEDGLQAGLAAAEHLACVRRPWSVENESGRIFAGAQRIAAE